jgi:hypothetical protein
MGRVDDEGGEDGEEREEEGRRGIVVGCFC